MAQTSSSSRVVTCSAPSNIALIKYWGKRDEELVLPVNSSLSVTLDDVMCSRTTAELNEAFEEDALVLNGQTNDFTQNKRFKNCLTAVREMAVRQHEGAAWAKWKCRIRSVNNFPTAAGLASSASGFACLVKTLCTLFELKEEYAGQFSGIARLGSGSACRSLEGGFVKWEMGEAACGKDSVASQVAPASHWPELRMAVMVVSSGRKANPSTKGMKTSVETSALMQHRIAHVAPERMVKIQEAIKQKDFPALAEIAMKDSNQFHAICADTFPPIRYMNEVSMAIVSLVHECNKVLGSTRFAYTFDAGPNAVVLCEERDLGTIIALAEHFFLPEAEAPAAKKARVQGPLTDSTPAAVAADLSKCLEQVEVTPMQGTVEYMMLSSLGEGSKVLPVSEAVVE